MFARTFATATVLVFLSAPAFAFYCPNQGKAIDHALSTASLSADQKAEVKKLRDQGMAPSDRFLRPRPWRPPARQMH